MRLTLSAAMNADEACTRQEAHGSSDAQTSELSGELNGVLDRVEALCMAVTIAIEIGSLDLDLCLLFVSSHHVACSDLKLDPNVARSPSTSPLLVLVLVLAATAHISVVSIVTRLGLTLA